ncbi:glycosyltransferase [Kineosporia sp. J2-2]|uniref:Glycosyltransferase n=1 Tax=Kineosporia corallincola TaxID=2835133 RepID=A0ABS5TMC1_9ACTN|nr:glycosyltransferase [Kineosporia corallincola]MBT0772150.1 glycosyltransferase [Kineosporia corallincola]
MRAAAVVIPANDEAGTIGPCLAAVRTATAGTPIPVVVVVVAHRCTDATEAMAREELSKLEGLAEGVVVRLGQGTVATARSTGAMAGLCLLAAYGVPFGQTWLLSTDADSRVPPDWFARYRRRAVPGTAAVTGMVRVEGWERDPVYAQIVRAGLHGDSHDHVYAANLAVRADAYLDVGGWPDQVPGEDAALLARLRRHGHTVVGAPEILVDTSGRTVARAPGGLGALLGRITGAAPRTPTGHLVPRQALRSPP